MWISLGVVKIIHEFGHGLSARRSAASATRWASCSCASRPALYCNVTDAWTLADKWKRIIISFAGIYVELIIASPRHVRLVVHAARSRS